MTFKNCFALMYIFILYILGAWLFLSGFLLKRHSILDHSSRSLNIAFNITCQDFSSLQRINSRVVNHLKSGAGVDDTLLPYNKLKRYKRAVVIIIDALRYDFTIFSNKTSRADEQYLNNMPVFKELLNDYPRQSSLKKLVADAPTTTLQRLKAITTGSLPTFIDLSLNFASTEIVEDNLVYQIRNNKEIVFMGDDTWEGLYPDHFKRSFPYPSFNVKDLDTVDYGILDHIFVELQKNDWDVLISHFLGVDHCGHRYGPRHPEMKRKLNEMDGMLRKVIPLLKEDTILFVLGDHGMTGSGDHGGDSDDEVDTALFVYSPSYIFPEKQTILSQSALIMNGVVFLTLWLIPVMSDDLQSESFKQILSTSLSVLLFTIVLPSYLIAGDGLALAVTIMVTVIALMLLLNKLSTKAPVDNSEAEFWLNAVMWSMLSWCWFYGTGHQATFPSIQWQAAFVLSCKEVVSYILSGILVLCNTFSSQVLHGVALPFLVIFTHPVKDFDASLTRLTLKYICFHGIKFLGASAACFVLRRHLMVWKIFSPKIVFEAVSLIVTMISVTVGYVFTLRTHNCYQYYLKSSIKQAWLSKQS